MVHTDLFQELQDHFVALEHAGTKVKLWKVTRNLNGFAEKLAKRAL
jgi:hypothetical protein